MILQMRRPLCQQNGISALTQYNRKKHCRCRQRPITRTIFKDKFPSQRLK
jgi:hypothetical protein